MNDTKTLGVRVREARDNRSRRSGKQFTQQMLAAKIGETLKWVRKLEKGEFYPDWDSLILLADTCGVETSFLLGEDLDREKYNDIIRGGQVSRTIDSEELRRY
ncbi:MAG: helix-turn-helix domain-containing protein [Firmicutes bacterium]|nr:helix-turn-helix domain-containing protein [Bacillota bacterium]MCL5057044.1 helix-turn-helix domain-containing protein [Actinomycetota bacterium]